MILVVLNVPMFRSQRIRRAGFSLTKPLYVYGWQLHG